MRKHTNRIFTRLWALALGVALVIGALGFGLAAGEEALPPATAEDTAAQPAPAAPEAPTVQEAPAAPEAPPVQDAPAAPEAPNVQDAPAAPEAQPAEASAPDATTETPSVTAQHMLTVEYVNEQNALLPLSDALPQNPMKVALWEGDRYEVALPAIAGWVCNETGKTVTMGAKDETVTVAYTAVPAPQAEAAGQPLVKLDDHLDELVAPDGPYVVIRCDSGDQAELGDRVTLIAELHGFGNLQVAYQWQRFDGKNWKDIKGENADKLVISKLESADFGEWRAMVTVKP